MKLQVYRLQIAERAYRFGQCADKIDSLNGAIAQQVSSLSNTNQGADIAAYESQLSEAKANVMDSFCSSFRTWQSCMSLIYQTYYNAQIKCWEKAIQAETHI